MNRSWLQGYEPTISRNTMTFVLPILSSAATDSIGAQIILADESLSPFKLQTMQTKAQPSEDGLWNVRFTLNLHKDRRNGDYAAIIRITGKDKQGAVLQTEIPYVFHIRDGQPTREVIRLQVEQIESDLKVGEDGIITIALTNPCKTVPFEQPVLEISDSTGDIIPQRSGVMYLDDLAPGETITVQFPITVLPKAAVSPHIMQFDMRWTALGQAVVQSEPHTLPVTQEIRMEHGGLRMADSVVAGDALTVTLPILNRGKASIMDVYKQQYGENWFFWPLEAQNDALGGHHHVPEQGEMTRDEAVDMALQAVKAQYGKEALTQLGDYQIGVICCRYEEPEGTRFSWELYITSDPEFLSNGFRVNIVVFEGVLDQPEVEVQRANSENG